MATEKQIAANRLNAARSTGPRTKSGKLSASKNARRHGFTVGVPDAQVTKMMAVIHNKKPEDLASLAEVVWEATAELARAEVALAQVRELTANLAENQDFEESFRVIARYRAEAESRRRTALRAWIETMKQGAVEAAK